MKWEVEIDHSSPGDSVAVYGQQSRWLHIARMVLQPRSQSWCFPGLPVYLHDRRLLVWEGDLTLLVKAGVVEVVDQSFQASAHRLALWVKSNLLMVVYPGLHHDSLGPWVGQPTIMDKRVQPDLDSMRSPKLLLPDQDMQASCVVPHLAT